MPTTRRVVDIRSGGPSRPKKVLSGSGNFANLATTRVSLEALWPCSDISSSDMPKHLKVFVQASGFGVERFWMQVSYVHESTLLRFSRSPSLGGGVREAPADF